MNEKQQLDAELTEILKHLPGWQLDPKYDGHCWCAVLIDGTGRGIHVNATQAKGRLYLSGTWPQDSEHRVHGPDKSLHITVARNRPPEKIADEITRRFLPWYLAAYAEQTERVANCNAARNRQQEVTVELAALLGADASRRLQSNPNQIYASGLTVDVHGNGDSVSIQLRYTTVKVAKAVLRAIVKAGGLTD
jgi:hypothetical protein